MQAAVDQQRFDVMYDSAFEILRQQAAGPDVRAWAIYLLVGYEQATLPRDTDALAVDRRTADSTRSTSGRFASVPDSD